MLHRIRLAMQNESTAQLRDRGGTVEVDETFVGGRLANMHKSKRAKIAEIKAAHSRLPHEQDYRYGFLTALW